MRLRLEGLHFSETYVDVVSNSVDDLLQGVKAGNSAINLTTGMVCHNDAINSTNITVNIVQTIAENEHEQFNAFLRRFDALNTLQAEWSATTDSLPLGHCPLDFFPGMGTAVPNVLVNPLRTRLFRVGLGIDTSLFQAFLEDRVLQTKIACSMLMIESIVAGKDVVVAPAKGPGIGGQHARIEARVPGTLHHGNCLFIIMALIQLEEPWAVSIGFSDVLDAVAASRRKAIGQIQFFCNFCHRELTGGMIDTVDANGSKTNRRRDFVAEDLGGRVPGVGINQGSRHDAMAEKCLAIC